MSAEYTPTTEHVRAEYTDHERYPESGRQFDRWLAAHDQEVAARAASRALRAAAGRTYDEGCAAWLHGRADRIEGAS